MPNTQAQDVINRLREYKDDARGRFLQRFFKTGTGEYAEGDILWGLSVPQTRIIAKEFKDLPISQIEKLLHHDIHEVRLCALIIMTHQVKQHSQELYDLYLRSTDCVNNWDLVDTSAPTIMGSYLIDKDRKILYKLAKSESLWERRIAIVSTFYFIKREQYEDTLKIAEILLKDRHDLIHKAVGWMLREMGKNSLDGADQLEEFLEEYAAVMPRTMLRYAIERMSAEKKQYYMKKKSQLI
ncbi:MAG: DNA alkylation repair protein [Weeksellaceae bacterium]